MSSKYIHELARQYRQLPQRQKQSYVDAAAADLRRYKREREDYVRARASLTGRAAAAATSQASVHPTRLQELRFEGWWPVGV